MLTIRFNKDSFYRALLGSVVFAGIVLARYGHVITTISLAGSIAWTMCYALRAVRDARGLADEKVTLLSVRFGK